MTMIIKLIRMLKALPTLLFFYASVALGVQVGDTYDSVVAEKGSPKSQIQAGDARILSYSDVTIKIKDNVVVSIKSVPPSEKSSSPPVQGSIGQPRTADAIKSELKDAVVRVNRIVNQPVPFVERTPEISSQCAWFGDGWFHPGAAIPDFASVDIRRTQETKQYEDFPYDSSNLTPDRAYLGTDLEFNSMTKFFYQDRSLPKKRLTEKEMLEINRLYRIIAKCGAELSGMGVPPPLK